MTEQKYNIGDYVMFELNGKLSGRLFIVDRFYSGNDEKTSFSVKCLVSGKYTVCFHQKEFRRPTPIELAKFKVEGII